MVTIRKQGNVCTAYCDESWRPINFTDFENPPEFYSILQTMSPDEAYAAYGKANVKFIEAPAPPVISRPPAPRLTEAQLRAQMAELGIPKDVQDRLAAQGGTASVTTNDNKNLEFHQDKEVHMVRQAAEWQELVIRELRILFAKYECVPDDPEVRAEVQYVVNFILQIWPDLEGEIVKMKERATKPRFKL